MIKDISKVGKQKLKNNHKYIIMNQIIRNTRFDNLVNYQTVLSSNSSQQTVAFESSADPNSLSSLIKDNQIVTYSLVGSNNNENIESNIVPE